MGRAGKHEQAQEHLAIAVALYHDMDMRFSLAQVGKELAHVHVIDEDADRERGERSQ